MNTTPGDFDYFGLCLEGFFFGFYSGIFAIHLQYHASKGGTDNTKNIIFYALGVLYVLSVALIALDIAQFVVDIVNDDISIMTYRLYIAQMTVFGSGDFLTQSILIHRCWIVWGRNIRVVIIPSILTFTYLVMWTARIGAVSIGRGEIDTTAWGNTMILTSLTVSMTVNALVTILIVFRIFKVFREIKSITTSDEKYLGVTGGRKLRSIIFIIIESHMALFAIQLARLVFSTGMWTIADFDVFQLITSIHEMLNGITIILVRVLMGLCFHDERSLVEAAGSLRFAADDPNPIPGTGSIGSDGVGPDDPNAIPDMVNISQDEETRYLDK